MLLVYPFGTRTGTGSEVAAPRMNRESYLPVYDFVIRAVDCRAITPGQVPDMVKEWREPSHSEFRPRNLWSLLDAFTEVYKSQSPNLTPARSGALHGLCDGAVGLAN